MGRCVGMLECRNVGNLFEQDCYRIHATIVRQILWDTVEHFDVNLHIRILVASWIDWRKFFNT